MNYKNGKDYLHEATLTSPDIDNGTLDGALLGATRTNIQKGPAIVNSGFVGTVTAAASTTVTFSSAADAIVAGYDATNPVLGVTLISNALTRYIVSWTNSTTCVVDSSVTWAGTAITSVQLPISFEATSAGVLKRATLADGTEYLAGNVGIGTTAPDKPLEINAATGGAVRLTYNDANGSASTYVDLSVDSSGNLSISPTGKTIIMPDAGKILWDLAPASDHTASGNIASETVGDAVAFGDVLYLNAGESKWKLADADASSTMPGMRMAVATIADDGTGNLMSKGVARDDSWSWTPKEPIYVSTTGTTGNTLTQTAPSGESDVIQIAGYALTATTMWFEPQIITTEVGIDAYDYSAETAIAITPSLLTAVPRVYFGNNASNQTYTLGALSAADVGKKFTVMKSGTGAGTAILQLPASTYAYSAAASSSAAGTVTLATAAYGSMTFMVTSATTIQLMNADGSLAFA